MPFLNIHIFHIYAHNFVNHFVEIGYMTLQLLMIVPVVLGTLKNALAQSECIPQEHFECGQIHAPLTSEGSVGTDQEILERHQLIQLRKSAASFAL